MAGKPWLLSSNPTPPNFCLNILGYTRTISFLRYVRPIFVAHSVRFPISVNLTTTVIRLERKAFLQQPLLEKWLS